ncbi:MAG TPA: hypothetical protein VKU86_12200 [Acidimicrobiales bacterium]|nr:hypothetical protein [Acidimicrobiales bacterium]
MVRHAESNGARSSWDGPGAFVERIVVEGMVVVGVVAVDVVVVGMVVVDVVVVDMAEDPISSRAA